MEQLVCENDLIGTKFTFSEDRLNQKTIQVDNHPQKTWLGTSFKGIKFSRWCNRWSGESLQVEQVQSIRRQLVREIYFLFVFFYIDLNSQPERFPYEEQLLNFVQNL